MKKSMPMPASKKMDKMEKTMPMAKGMSPKMQKGGKK